ncbi:MAG: FKBP-type peptidyl-prolyl cis-trans isomerase [Candidatus Nomurabacteria bacterium]|nr:FKBP-type peptidyl-prolyl cis-trans isomerase [Candidatus Nomurabacteria bacterium]
MIEVEKKMSLSKKIVIWAIAGLMALSVVIVFVNIIMSNNSASKLSDEVAEAQGEMETILKARDEELGEQAKTLSEKYAKSFAEYKKLVGKFDSVSALKIEDIKKGDGQAISEGVQYSAYYIGFLSDGTVFDSSFKDFEGEITDDLSEVLSLPISSTGGGAGMIEGWTKGVENMQIGGVRKITVPSAMAYGDTAQNNIPAGSTLTFIVMVIPKIDNIAYDGQLVELCKKAYSSYAAQYGEDYIVQVCQEEYGNK